MEEADENDKSKSYIMSLIQIESNDSTISDKSNSAKASATTANTKQKVTMNGILKRAMIHQSE